MSRKPFWDTSKPFIISKGTLLNDNIITSAKIDSTINVKGTKLVFIKARDEIRDLNVLVEMFNNDYINIIGKASVSVPKFIGNLSNLEQDRNTVLNAAEYCKNHPSIMQIKENFKHSNPFDFPEDTVKY